MEHKCAQDIVVILWQFLQKRAERLVLVCAVLYTYTGSILHQLKEGIKLTSSRDKALVKLVRQERVRQLPEVRLEHAGDARDVVKGINVRQIESVIIAPLKQLLDLLRLRRAARLSVYALIVHPCGSSVHCAWASNFQKTYRQPRRRRCTW